jgi:hypothetical protein
MSIEQEKGEKNYLHTALSFHHINLRVASRNYTNQTGYLIDKQKSDYLTDKQNRVTSLFQSAARGRGRGRGGARASETGRERGEGRARGRGGRIESLAAL